MREDLLRRLGAGSAALVERLWTAVEQGRISEGDFRRAAAEVIALARVKGQAAAVAAFRGHLEAAFAVPVPAQAAPVIPEQDRIQTALATILADPEGRLPRLVRLAADEPIQAAIDAFASAMADSDVVSGWTRGLDGDPCELCVWWWREGRVWRDDFTMPRHTGCACSQVPVIEERTTNYQTAAQMAGALASRRRRNS